MTRACQGVVFVSVDLVKKLMEKTTTKTGLWVTVDVIAATYPTGVKAPVDFKKTMAIVFDDLLPKWNDRAMPQRLESRRRRDCSDRIAILVQDAQFRTVIEFAFLSGRKANARPTS